MVYRVTKGGFTVTKGGFTVTKGGFKSPQTLENKGFLPLNVKRRNVRNVLLYIYL